MENLSIYILKAQPLLREVWVAGHGRGPHHTSKSGRGLLERPLPSYVQAMPPAQERARAGWYDDVTWTWGDYFDELTYISYDYEVE